MPDALTQVRLKVPAVHCHSCVEAIGERLERLPGLRRFDGDPASRTVTVAFDATQLSVPDIERALVDAGFPVEPASPADSDADAPPAHPLRPVLVAVGLAAVLATAGYYLGFRGYIYGVALPNAFDRLGVLVVGAVAGAAAFFSPCVFPLLPGYVSYYLMSSPGTSSTADSPSGEALASRPRPAGEESAAAPSRQVGRTLRCGAAAALGIVVVNLAIGAVILIVGAASPFRADVREEGPVILGLRFLAGLVIAVMGARTLLGRRLRSGRLARVGSGIASRVRRTGGLGGFFLYGLTYNAAGIGCTGPILLGMMLYYALVSERALAAFLTFTLTMGALMVGITALVGLAARGPVLRLRAATPAIQKVGAVMLVTLGTYTMLIQSFDSGREVFVRVFLRYLL